MVNILAYFQDLQIVEWLAHQLISILNELVNGRRPRHYNLEQLSVTVRDFLDNYERILQGRDENNAHKNTIIIYLKMLQALITLPNHVIALRLATSLHQGVKLACSTGMAVYLAIQQEL
jgi:hypothetical protein